jgi:hypothetical protein
MVNQGERTESDFSTTPQVLDIIKIDGRWAQSIIGGRTIIFLDDGASQEIVWDDYLMVGSYGSHSLAQILTQPNESISSKETERINWGPEQELDPSLKLQVRVFGKYEKK